MGLAMTRQTILTLAFLLATTAHAWARGGGGCFEEGTPVLTPSGAVAIEKLTVGSEVLTAAAGGASRGTVQACIRVTPAEFVEIACPSVTLHVTAEHPFQVAPGVFRQASNLQAGDVLWRYDGSTLQPERITSTRRVRASRPAYNLMVSPGGTYLAAGIVVHNKGCFLPDTPILRADGTQAAIRDILAGDEVLAFTPAGLIVHARVQGIVTHKAAEYFVVATEHALLRVTAEHPFYVGEGTFKTIESLSVGNTVYAFDGQGLSLQHIVSMQRVGEPATVYNLQTDAPHTFFASGIAVHNKGGGGCFPAGTQILSPAGMRAIETIAAGETILAVNEDHQAVPSTVEAVHVARCELLTVQTSSRILTTTADHPLLLAGADCGMPCFIPAGRLKPGDRIVTWQHGRAQEQTVLDVKRLGVEQTVYTLGVGGPHTFIADGFVVHNKGGGGGSHSSGYHSSGGSGSGGADAPWWIAPTIFVGMFGGIFILSMLQKKNKKDEDLDYVYPRAAIDRKASKTTKLLAFIAQTDHTMNPDALLYVTRTTFLKLQECWQARNYDPMKTLMMPDLYGQHCKQLEGMVRSHEINVIDNLNIEKIDIINIRYTNKSDQREFTALITARAKDYYIDDRKKSFLRGDKKQARFQEFWTFHRQGDMWLLREIEQSREGEWMKQENFFEPFTLRQLRKFYSGGDPNAPQAEGGPVGPWVEKDVSTKETKIERMLDFLAKTDPIWDRQQMIERTRQIFMNVFLAQEGGDASAVSDAELMPDVAAHLRQEITARKAGETSIEFRNLCVRKVELLLVRNYADNSRDEFVVRISAHAQTVMRKGEQVVHEDEYVTPFEQYWTMGRHDRQWKLKEVLPPAKGQQAVKEENLDEDSTPAQVQWYYRQERAN